MKKVFVTVLYNFFVEEVKKVEFLRGIKAERRIFDTSCVNFCMLFLHGVAKNGQPQ